MKSLFRSLFVFALLGMASSAFAVSMTYVKIEMSGVSRVVALTCSGGVCKASVPNMGSGKYTFTLCDANGVALMKAKEKASHSRSMSMNYGKIVFSCDIVSPRDAASGLPTGKRMHKPFVITKELDAASPKFVATGDVDGDGTMEITMTCKNSDGGIMAMDDWEAPKN